jgi:hypothetical protein
MIVIMRTFPSTKQLTLLQVSMEYGKEQGQRREEPDDWLEEDRHVSSPQNARYRAPPECDVMCIPNKGQPDGRS